MEWGRTRRGKEEDVGKREKNTKMTNTKMKKKKGGLKKEKKQYRLPKNEKIGDRRSWKHTLDALKNPSTMGL